MKNDVVNLIDMKFACERIRTIVDGVDIDDFVLDEQATYAVSFELLALGEASKHVYSSTRHDLDDIPWQDLRLMRNMLAHEHFTINPRTLYRTAVHDVPAIEKALDDYLSRYRLDKA